MLHIFKQVKGHRAVCTLVSLYKIKQSNTTKKQIYMCVVICRVNRSEIDKLSYSRPFEAWGGWWGIWGRMDSDFSSVQFSPVAQFCPTLWPHGPQHARPPCPSPIPRVYPDFIHFQEEYKGRWGKSVPGVGGAGGLLIRGHGGHHVWLKQPAPMASLPIVSGLPHSLCPRLWWSHSGEKRRKLWSSYLPLQAEVPAVPCVLAWQNTKWSEGGGYSRKTPYVTPWFWHGTNSLCYRA